IKHDLVDPVRRWVADEPQLYLNADHNVRMSSEHRDHSDEMAQVLGQAAVLLAPGANALAAGETAAAAEAGAALKPYGGPGGGHHVPAKAAFKGAPGYHPNKALAMPNA